MNKLFLLLSLALAMPAVAQQRPVGLETTISFAEGGTLRDWQPAAPDGQALYVRDRNEQWYRVALTGKCRLDWAHDTLSYTTDSNGTFDRFSVLRVARYPQQVCAIASIRTSAPPPGRPGATKRG